MTLRRLKSLRQIVVGFFFLQNLAAGFFFIKVHRLSFSNARVVELVDTLVLGTSDESREGSSPFSRTIKKFLSP